MQAYSMDLRRPRTQVPRERVVGGTGDGRSLPRRTRSICGGRRMFACTCTRARLIAEQPLIASTSEDGLWPVGDVGARWRSTCRTILGPPTRTPLTTWFEARVAPGKTRSSRRKPHSNASLRHGRALPRWTMRRRYRVAMVAQPSGAPGFDGTVDGGESLIRPRPRRGIAIGARAARASSAIAVEVKDPKGFGRQSGRHVPDASGASLRPPFVPPRRGGSGRRAVQHRGMARATMRTCPSTATCARKRCARHGTAAGHVLPRCIKRWRLGTHQGSVDRQPPAALPGRVHLPLQPPHFASLRPRVFRRLLEQAVVTAEPPGSRASDPDFAPSCRNQATRGRAALAALTGNHAASSTIARI